jgi:hypothetical protein
MQYLLGIEYPMDDTFGDYDEAIRGAVGDGEMTGSGAGFGFRDMTFEFDAEADARAACERVKALKLSDLAAEVVINDPADFDDEEG